MGLGAWGPGLGIEGFGGKPKIQGIMFWSSGFGDVLSACPITALLRLAASVLIEVLLLHRTGVSRIGGPRDETPRP